MKKFFTVLSALVLLVIACEKAPYETELLTDLTKVDFKYNSSDEFSNQLSYILSTEEATVKYFTTKKNGNEILNALTIGKEGKEYTIQFNLSMDSALLYNLEDSSFALRATIENDFLKIQRLDFDHLNGIYKEEDTFFSKIDIDNINEDNLQFLSLQNDNKSDEFVETKKKWYLKSLPEFLEDVIKEKTEEVKNSLKETSDSFVDDLKDLFSSEDELSDYIEIEDKDDIDLLIEEMEGESKLEYVKRLWDEYLRTDCNGDLDGTATKDKCGFCTGGNTEYLPCEKDCQGVWGGWATYDKCGECVGGTTGKDSCKQDCNLDWGGTAIYDNCNECVGGNTGKTPCEQDCNNVWGGLATYDNCGECVGGTTGLDSCKKDCNLKWGGEAYYDDCGDCVGGMTGKEACDLTSYFKSAVLGNWTVTTLESGAMYTMTLKADGTGSYLVNNVNYSVTWQIAKINGKYHLREDGFYHYGFEQYRTFDISLPNNFLTKPITFFETYTDFGSGPENAGRRYTKN